MRNIRPFIFALLVALAVSGPAFSARQQVATEPRESVAILTIGNSFTVNACQYLPLFAEAGGKDLLIFPANLGGASFDRHFDAVKAHEDDPASDAGRPYKNLVDPKTGEKKNFSLKEALQAADWDYVTIQQVSSRSFRPETFGPAHELIAYIREHAQEAEILIHQTWAYHEDYEGYKEGVLSRESMYAGLTAAYNELADAHGLRIIPSGDAFHAARATPRWTYQRDPAFDYENPSEGELPDQSSALTVGYMWRSSGREPVFHIDYRHANVAGKYLGAAVWYEMLFGEPAPADAEVPAGLASEDAAALREIAHGAVRARVGAAAVSE